MITIQRLRKAINLPAERDEDLSFIKQAVISLWEEKTAMLWNLRTARVEIHRHRISPRPRNLLLELQPATTITKVEERSTASGASWSTLTSSNYMLFGRRQLEKLGSPWGEIVRVTYDGGVAEADNDVQKALIVQAQFMIARFDDSKIAVSAQNFRGGAGTLEDADFHPFFKAMAEAKGSLV